MCLEMKTAGPKTRRYKLRSGRYSATRSFRPLAALKCA